MTDEPSLTRQLMLIRTLCARRLGATVKELAREMGVTEKTIRRDFKRLLRCGFPLVETTEDHGRKSWRLTNDG
jgi:predicted DNA-binding transcriptional regulator YafY